MTDDREPALVVDDPAELIRFAAIRCAVRDVLPDVCQVLPDGREAADAIALQATRRALAMPVTPEKGKG